MEPHDEELIEKWKAGDEAAAVDLVRKHLPEVESACRKYFLEQRDVRELTLEAAGIVIEKGIRLFDPSRGRFSTFLEKLIRSTCIDKQRELAGVEEHSRAKKEQLKSAVQGTCVSCGMPVRFLRSGKVAYNFDGAPHDKTCAAGTGCSFPHHIQIKRSRNFKFDSSVGRAESVRTNDDGDIFETAPWDVAEVVRQRYFGFDDESEDNWYFAPRLSDYRIIIERVITKRAGGTPDEDDDDTGETEDLSWGAFLFDDDTPTFLYDIPIEYLSVMLELSKGVKLAEIANVTGIREDTIRKYFNRLKTELRIKAPEKKERSKPKVNPAIAKLSDEFSSWRSSAGERINPFDKKKLL